jgi:hypothetical protein
MFWLMAEKEITGYELTDRLRKTRRRNPLTASEQALYYELVAICNDDAWPDTFNCSNDELCSALSISENTLNASRNRLIQVGLIFYRSGKSKRIYGTYSFTKKLTTSNFDTNPEAYAATNPATNTGANPATNPADYNKTKVKPKKNENSVTNVTAPASKNSKKEITAEHWQPIVEVWFSFYEENFKVKPTFKGAAPKALQSILARLRQLCTDAGYVWDEPYAKKVFTHFLMKAIADKWRRENFILHILNSHFDAIIQKDEQQQGNSKSANNKRNIDIRAAFDAIDRMPG